MAEIILAVLCIIFGISALGYAALSIFSAGMGNPEDQTAPVLISLAVAIAGIGGGISILVF